jgi:hypothetical protein
MLRFYGKTNSNSATSESASMASLEAPKTVEERLLKQQALLDTSISAVQKKFGVKHPKLDQAIFTDMTEIYQKTNPEYLKEYKKLAAKENPDGSTNPVWLDKQLREQNNDAQLKILNELIERHSKRHPELSKEQASADVKLVWDGVDKQYHGPSLTDRLVGTFYDEDKGGVRYGGIAGAVLAGVGAFALTGGGGGGFMGIITMVLMTALGAYGGNLVVDEFINPKAATPGTAPSQQPSQALGQQQAQAQGAAPQQAQAQATQPVYEQGKVPHYIARPDLPLEKQTGIPQEVLDQAKQSQPAIPGMQYVPQMSYSLGGSTPAAPASTPAPAPAPTTGATPTGR